VWNIRGLGQKGRRSQLVELVQKYQVDGIFFFDLKSRCFIQNPQAQANREPKCSLLKQGGDPS
jgi:uncharacterized lipoprotein YddW (UPF0748 family)